MIKDSVYASTAIQTLQKEEGLDGIQIAKDLNISPQLVSNIKHGHRKLHKDIAQASMKIYDCPEYALELLHQFSDGYTAPRLTGRAIEKHRLALEEFTIQQVREVIRILEEVSLVKPPGETTAEERERIKEIIYELLDAEAAIANLKAILADEYQISLKECIRARKPYWKAKGWI
ncbi:hypothetical protein [Caldibacillus phage CBP1]|uniref:Uncharacterized protein n=1 Tax=Caldibacillus debilis GB1 TaxID=1339248 RepID=A0A420VIW1_9BACI|nr:XRE family transcriptional regulator [Caldibacillus debilis]ATB52701.1 hypothetical protein [Caldibacillus phage CBP1]RKO63527.1 hypothetical protein Cdeb_02790 [Caldibacillus debilis GB1]